MDKYTVYYQTVGSRGFRILGSLKGDMGPLPNLTRELVEAKDNSDAEYRASNCLIWRDGWPVDEEPFKTWLEEEENKNNDI